MATVQQIIKHFLMRNKFGGLHNDAECGCDLDDLMCCEEDMSGCKPGYKSLCGEYCGDHKYHIVPEKE